MSTRVLYNSSYGGWGLSYLAVQYLMDIYFLTKEQIDKLDRHDSILLEVYDKFGSEWLSGDCCTISVTEVFTKAYNIEVYDGRETIVQVDCDYVIAGNK